MHTDFFKSMQLKQASGCTMKRGKTGKKALVRKRSFWHVTILAPTSNTMTLPPPPTCSCTKNTTAYVFACFFWHVTILAPHIQHMTLPPPPHPPPPAVVLKIQLHTFLHAFFGMSPFWPPTSNTWPCPPPPPPPLQLY